MSSHDRSVSPDEDDRERGVMDRMRWTDAAEAKFEAAVEAAGGVLTAVPRAILQSLDIPGVTYPQVKSHLQRYRTAYVADLLQRGLEVEGGVSEAQIRASRALLEKRRGAGAGSAPPSTGRRRPREASLESGGRSPEPPAQRMRALPSATLAPGDIVAAALQQLPPSTSPGDASSGTDCETSQGGTEAAGGAAMAATAAGGATGGEDRSQQTGYLQPAGSLPLQPAGSLPQPGKLGAAALQPARLPAARPVPPAPHLQAPSSQFVAPPRDGAPAAQQAPPPPAASTLEPQISASGSDNELLAALLALGQLPPQAPQPPQAQQAQQAPPRSAWQPPPPQPQLHAAPAASVWQPLQTHLWGQAQVPIRPIGQSAGRSAFQAPPQAQAPPLALHPRWPLLPSQAQAAPPPQQPQQAASQATTAALLRLLLQTLSPPPAPAQLAPPPMPAYVPPPPPPPPPPVAPAAPANAAPSSAQLLASLLQAGSATGVDLTAVLRALQ